MIFFNSYTLYYNLSELSGIVQNAKSTLLPFYMKVSNTFTVPDFQPPCMEKNAAWEALPGSTTDEKLRSLGAMKGSMLDIRMLDEISRRYDVEVYLFFEEDLARTRTLESVLEEFDPVPEYGRPYISVGSFLRFTRENDPSFERTMRDFPLVIEVVITGEMQSPRYGTPVGTPVRFITGLMPFLEEMDVGADPIR